MRENSSSGRMRRCKYCAQYYIKPCDGKDKGCQNKIYKDTGHVNFGLPAYVEPVAKGKKKPPTRAPKVAEKKRKVIDLF